MRKCKKDQWLIWSRCTYFRGHLPLYACLSLPHCWENIIKLSATSSVMQFIISKSERGAFFGQRWSRDKMIKIWIENWGKDLGRSFSFFFLYYTFFKEGINLLIKVTCKVFLKQNYRMSITEIRKKLSLSKLNFLCCISLLTTQLKETLMDSCGNHFGHLESIERMKRWFYQHYPWVDPTKKTTLFKSYPGSLHSKKSFNDFILSVQKFLLRTHFLER